MLNILKKIDVKKSGILHLFGILLKKRVLQQEHFMAITAARKNCLMH